MLTLRGGFGCLQSSLQACTVELCGGDTNADGRHCGADGVLFGSAGPSKLGRGREFCLSGWARVLPLPKRLGDEVKHRLGSGVGASSTGWRGREFYHFCSLLACWLGRRGYTLMEPSEVLRFGTISLAGTRVHFDVDTNKLHADGSLTRFPSALQCCLWK